MSARRHDPAAHATVTANVAGAACDAGVPAATPGSPAALDVERLRAEIPALAQTVHGRPLVYLDSASTALKPRAVIDAVRYMYERACANIHRGVHALSMEATERYEAVREKVARFLGAHDPREVVFVRGTTEALNLVSTLLGRAPVGPADDVVITALEHHSNIVPWHFVGRDRGAPLRVIPVDDQGRVDLDAAASIIGPRTRVVSIAHVSNALGTVVPVRALADLAHAHGALVVVDGAQAAPHLPIDVAALGCDFYCFSGHKLYGPTGAGVLWGRRRLLDAMPPWQGGGDMIERVAFEDSTYREAPYRFEAGTPDIAAVVGLGAAIDWLAGWDATARAAHEASLLEHAEALLARIPRVRLWGAAPRVAALSFSVEGVHPHDVATVLDAEGVAVRAGHHCAEPLCRRLGLPAGTVRASFACYNTHAEVEALGRAVELAVRMFSPGTAGTPGRGAEQDR